MTNKKTVAPGDSIAPEATYKVKLSAPIKVNGHYIVPNAEDIILKGKVVSEYISSISEYELVEPAPDGGNSQETD